MCCSLQELREDVAPWTSLEAAALRAAVSTLIHAHLPGQPHSTQEQQSSFLFHR